MVHDFEIRKINAQTSLFQKVIQKYEILCDGATLTDLLYVLKSVISDCKTRPLSNEEQDLLCDLYNSISLFKLKHPKL